MDRFQQLSRSFVGWAPWLLLLVYWLQFWNRLCVDWSSIPQYAFGWCVPFVALGLFYFRWEYRPAPGELSVRERRLVAGGMILVFLLHIPMGLFEEANLGWRLLLWLREFWLLALSFAALLLAGGWPWARHFAFPLCFTAIAVPWPSSWESAFIQSLTRICAAIAVEVLNIAGLAAVRHGNLIEVSAGVVGVEEACSGIRGLQTSLMISLVLGELGRLSAWRRGVLVLAGGVVALLLNLLRAIALSALAADRGLSAVGEWHDVAGYLEYAGILIALILVYLLLQGGSVVGSRSTDATAGSRPLPVSVPLVAFLVLLSSPLATAIWFGVSESRLFATTRWTVRQPAAPSERFPNFRTYPIADQTRQLLQAQRGWSYGWTEPEGLDVRLFFFQWPRAGNPNVYSSISGHRPETCMPASGFVLDEVVGDVDTLAHGIPLSFRQYRFRSSAGTVYAFYCFWEYGRAPGQAKSSSWDRIEAALTGRRMQERQMLQLFVTGASNNDQAAAALRTAVEKLVVPL